MDETRLLEKLASIEALFAGATTKGEKVAAGRARDRILGRLGEIRVQELPIEYKFTLPDLWSRKVLVALMRRYGLEPYRYRRQRHTTVMVRVPKSFVDETLWPHYKQLSATLDAYLAEVTDRVVARAVHEDVSEAAVVNEPRQLEMAVEAKPGKGRRGSPR